MKRTEMVLSGIFVFVIILQFFVCHSIRLTLTTTAYDVSLTGNDTNVGISVFPWKTIQKAVASVLAQSTLYVPGGVYYQVVTKNASGTQTNPITFIFMMSLFVCGSMVDLIDAKGTANLFLVA
jgi:hypothetical protein